MENDYHLNSGKLNKIITYKFVMNLYEFICMNITYKFVTNQAEKKKCLNNLHSLFLHNNNIP